MSGSQHEAAVNHLVRPDRQEDLCFALWYQSRGDRRVSAVIHRLILPQSGERRVHGNASFLPAYFERAVGEAARAGAGLAFLHSHIGPGWQGMSPPDVEAELGHAPAVQGATGLPFVGLTVGSDGSWSARFWEKTAPREYARRWGSTVRVVGEKLTVTYNEQLLPKPSFREELGRTVSAWGEEAQAHLARLRIGVVGAGSVGSLIGESLGRLGISSVKVIDFDTVERVNLDRLLHATLDDAANLRSKASVLARALRVGATAENFNVEAVEYSVCEEAGYRAALDCDVLFSCVDRPWPRAVLNQIAYAHLIPVVDGGIRVNVTPNGTLKRADWKAHIAGPTRRCLECLGQYDSGLVAAEREECLDDPSYIEGLPTDHPFVANQNVFSFSMAVASLQSLQMLMMVIAPLGIANPGEQMYHFVPGIMDHPQFGTCNPKCPYPTMIGKADVSGWQVTGVHRAAELKRKERSITTDQRPSRLRYILEYITRLSHRPKPRGHTQKDEIRRA